MLLFAEANKDREDANNVAQKKNHFESEVTFTAYSNIVSLVF